MGIDSFAHLGFGVFVENVDGLKVELEETDGGAAAVSFGWCERPTAYAVVAADSWRQADLDYQPKALGTGLRKGSKWEGQVRAFLKAHGLKAIGEIGWILGVSQC